MARVAAAGALFSLAPPANLCTRGCTNSRTCRATPSNCSCHQPSTSGSTSCLCFNRVGFRVSFRGWHEPLLQCSNKAWERRVKVSQKTCSGNKWLWSWFSKNSLRDCFKVYAGDQPHPPPKPPMPLVGHLAPDFEAEAVFEQEFIKIKLSSYFGKKFVVLFFYPLDFTFVCPTEITQFSDRYDEFQKLNTEVIAISTDSVFSHLAWIQTDRNNGGLGELRYPIASDLTKSISRKYTVLISDQGVALRGLFILDKQGVIQHATVNNLAIGRSVDETIRTLQAIQHVQQNPDEVCAAGWQPGDKPLKQGKDYLK